MKLALIRRRFAATGGAELYLQRLLVALADRGHELHLVAESWEQAPPGVTLHAIRIADSRSIRPLRFAEAAQRELAGQKYDCVFSLERTLKQDVYRAGDGVHRVWLERRRQFAPWWKKPFVGLGAFHRNMKWLEAQTFNPANTRRVIVNSEMVKREVLAHFPFPAERIHVVRNGVDVARFRSGKRSETRARFGVKEEEFLLLFVGSGWERKGLRFVLRAIDVEKQILEIAVPNPRTRLGLSPSCWVGLKLLVVGKGKQPFGTPPNVIFAGPMADAANAYAAADLFVSLPIYEPSANVVVEALAAGLPVVTSVQNGASELIQENVNGNVLANPADLASVVRAIAFWLAKGTSTPRTTGTELNIDRNVDETLAILEMAAREKAR